MTSSHINCRTHTYTHTETAKEKALVERKQTAVKTKIHITDEHRTKRRRTNQRARESERAALAHPEVTHIYTQTAGRLVRGDGAGENLRFARIQEGRSAARERATRHDARGGRKILSYETTNAGGRRRGVKPWKIECGPFHKSVRARDVATAASEVRGSNYGH